MAKTARAKANPLAGEFMYWFGRLLDAQGAREPVRPKYLRYPSVPRQGAAVALKSIFVALLCIGVASGAATVVVGNAAHHATALGEPLFEGVYAPTDYVQWTRLRAATLAESDRASLATAGADPRTVHAAFALGDRFVFWGVGLAIVLSLIVSSRPARMPRDLAGLKGTAEWASFHDVQRAGLIGTPAADGVFLGEFDRPPLAGIIPRAPVSLVYPGPRHVLTIAASRSGKDVGTNTITALATWPHSIIYSDPKGEGHLQTSGVRQALYNNEIVRFAPGAGAIGSSYVDDKGVRHDERFGSTCWNPLEEIALGTDFEFSELLQTITMVVDPSGKQIDGDNGHWFKTARIGIKAIACKVLYDPLEPVKSLSRVADIFGGAGEPMNEAQAKLGGSTDGAAAGSIEAILEQYLGFTATGFGATPAWLTRSRDAMRMAVERELLVERSKIGISLSEVDYQRFEAERRHALDAQMSRLDNQMRHPDLERDLRTMLRIKGEESASVYSTINANLTPWLDPLVMRNTARCDARIEDIVNRERPVTWYNVSPINRADVMRPIIKLWYTMAHRKLIPDMDVDRASKRTKSPWRHPAIWLMNERGSLGVIEIENESVPVMASYGFIYHTLVQGTGQLKEIGGEQRIVEANSGIQVFHTPSDFEEQEKLSQRLGNRTVMIEQTSTSQGHVTRSWQTEQMPLLTPGQVHQLPTEPIFIKDRTGAPRVDADGSPRVKEEAYQVIFAPNCPPIYSRKAQWFRKPRLRELIAAIPSVIPQPLSASRMLAQHYAIEEHVRNTDPKRETDGRRKTRVAESIAMRRLDPEQAMAALAASLPTASGGSAGSAVAAETESDTGSGGGRQRRRESEHRTGASVEFDERVVPREREGGSPASGFDSILDRGSR